MALLESLFGFFRRNPPITNPAELADFIDTRAAFLVQKGMFDYARARSGHYAKVLLAEKEFHAAMNESRWRAYPMGLAMVGEMVEGLLRPYGGGDQRAMLDRLTPLVLGVFDRYPVPPELGAEKWAEARERLARRLDQIGTHPPKRVIDIPEQYIATYWKLMPFDESIKTNDMPTTLAYLKLTLNRMADDLTKRMDPAAMAREMIRESAPQH
jgi:hypothetical protein